MSSHRSHRERMAEINLAVVGMLVGFALGFFVLIALFGMPS